MEFERSVARRFDLVIGADGLHSAVRRAAFGEVDRFERHLGNSVAAFTATGYPLRDEDVYVGRYAPGRQVWRYSLRDDRTAFTLMFATPSRPNVAPSLMSGQGPSFAMAGANLLAGELRASDGDYEAAFGRYQARFKPFIDAQQEAAVRAIRWYAPRMPLDLRLRNGAIRLIALPFVSRRVRKRFVDIPYDLPDYPSRRA